MLKGFVVAKFSITKVFVKVMRGELADGSTMGLRPFTVHNTGSHHGGSITNGSRQCGSGIKEDLLKKCGVGRLGGSSGHKVGMPEGQGSNSTLKG